MTDTQTIQELILEADSYYLKNELIDMATNLFEIGYTSNLLEAYTISFDRLITKN